MSSNLIVGTHKINPLKMKLVKIKLEKVKLTGTKPFLPFWAPRFLRVLEFRIRTKIFRQKRYLIDRWKIEK